VLPTIQQDSSGNGYTGTASVAISSVSAPGTIFDGAIDFDGSTQSIDTGEKFSFICSTGVFSVVFWLKSSIANSGGVGSICGSAASSPFTPGLACYFDDRSGLGRDNTLRSVLLLEDFASTEDVSVDSAITDGDFHMIAMVGDGSNLRLYLDGSTPSKSLNSLSSIVRLPQRILMIFILRQQA